MTNLLLYDTEAVNSRIWNAIQFFWYTLAVLSISVVWYVDHSKRHVVVHIKTLVFAIACALIGVYQYTEYISAFAAASAVFVFTIFLYLVIRVLSLWGDECFDSLTSITDEIMESELVERLITRLAEWT